MAPRRAAVAGAGGSSEAFMEGAVAMAKMSMLIDNFGNVNA
jgi:hypothetical protein